MKKLLALLAIAGLSVSIIGCGEKPKPKAPVPPTTPPTEGAPAEQSK